MRIIYVINAFTWGGAEKLVYDLAIRMAAQVDFVGIAALYKKDDDTEADMVETLESHGIKTLILGKGVGTGRIKGVLSICKFAKENKAELLHGHCSVPMLFAKIVGQMLKVPVVCTIHTTRGYSREKEKVTAWMADQYVSIGQAAEKYMLEELKIKQRKITRIYNAIDIGEFKNRDKEPHFWTQHGGKDDQIALLNVARVTEAKNQICLLRALNTAVQSGRTDLRLYFLGYYEEKEPVFGQLQDYIRENQLDAYVSFLGMHKNVNEYLANADCFVMTSWYEGLSVAFLEAVISGIPIIVTDLPFVQELNEISECAVVIPQNDDKALAEVLMNGNYQRQKPHTIRLFEEKFSMDEFVNQHLQLYQRL